MNDKANHGRTEALPVLLLEPDQWRFRGMSVALEHGSNVEIVGERDYARILTMETPPDDLKPRVCVISQRLIVEFGIATIPHVKILFPGCVVLVQGDHESLDAIASILAAGGAGFFSLSAPPEYLGRAVSVVADGKLWGPREAVALMASRPLPQQQEPAFGEDLTDADRNLLRYLHEGLANKEIANRLQIAEVTVKTRLGRLYKRFGVNTRLQLLATAMKLGVIKPDGD